jgi:hypothetical protein
VIDCKHHCRPDEVREFFCCCITPFGVVNAFTTGDEVDGFAFFHPGNMAVAKRPEYVFDAAA